MNQSPSYIDVHHSHFSHAQPYASSHPATTGALPHYSHYASQPHAMHPASTSYAPAASYPQYGYASTVSSSPQPVSLPPTTSMAGHALVPLTSKLSISVSLYFSC